MAKGIAWLPVAIGIIFLAEILIFSFAFTKVTVFSREALSSNVIFEGDELETYARSITNSVQLSIAQAIHEFIKEKTMDGTATWQSYGTDYAPNPADTSAGLMQRIEGYMNKFLDLHRNAEGNKDSPRIVFPPDMGEAFLTIKENYVNAYFQQKPDEPEMELTKEFFVASFSRKFMAESILVTVFGEMMSAIRQMISADLIGQYAIWGIGNPGAEVKKPDACEVPNRDGTTERHSYIDEDTGCTTTNGGDPADKSCFKTGQTTTKGAKVYCSSDKSEKLCSPEDFNPCPPKGTYTDPSAEEVYPYSHKGQTYGSAQNKIKQYATGQLLCLESILDHGSEDYTVAFDGDIKTDASVDGKCEYKQTGNRCGGEITDEICFVDRSRNIIYYYWQCYQEKKAVCDYRHYDKADLTVRYQEDGFVYWWGDSIKIIFKAISGNMQGLSAPSAGLPPGAPGTGSGLSGSQPVQPT